MTEPQKLTIERAESARKVNRLLESVSEAELAEARKEHETIEERYIAALKRDAGQGVRTGSENDDPELRRMLGEAHVGAVLAAVRSTSGSAPTSCRGPCSGANIGEPP